jgi:hypothetical protein
MFNIVGGLSLLAIFGGLFAQKSLGTELASTLVVGGAIVGSLNVIVKFASWFKK